MEERDGREYPHIGGGGGAEQVLDRPGTSPAAPEVTPFLGTTYIASIGQAVGLYSLAVGTICMIAIRRARAKTRILHSLLPKSGMKLSWLNYEVMPRDPLLRFAEKGRPPICTQRLDLYNADLPVVLVGDCRSGKTVYLANAIRNELYPWWRRFIFPYRGLYLPTISFVSRSRTITDWLNTSIITTATAAMGRDAWSVIMDQVQRSYSDQWIRSLLVKLFPSQLPEFLRPQPTIIVVDDAEELLRAYRSHFLIQFGCLVRLSRDTNLLRIVFVVNSENAVKALHLMGSGCLSTIRAPKVSRAAVVETYGGDFAKVFDDCDSCIGIALEYVNIYKQPRGMTAKEYASERKQQLIRDNNLTDEITHEEYLDTLDRK